MATPSKTPRGLRTHIAFFGRRNVGKSSLVNALLAREASIVSDVAGTTTDPVSRAMELSPVGPVLLVDTAGVDDDGVLGEKRVKKTQKALERTDLAVIVCGHSGWGDIEERMLTEICALDTPALAVFNQCDRITPDSTVLEGLAQRNIRAVQTSATDGSGLDALKLALAELAPPPTLEQACIAADLVPPGEVAVLVVPIDKEAPKGRLILPQVQTIRDLLDGDAMTLVVKERELAQALERLNVPPALVITDSQAFLRVAGEVPPEIPLTSFSVLFSRFKGDLLSFVDGATHVRRLQPGDRILMLEACAHKPVNEDIGRVKIPRWLRQLVGELHFEHVQGSDFPEDVTPYRLAVHCGACVQNRKQVITRVQRCKKAGLPITNYGLCIAAALGILERALSPFPAALERLAEPGPKDPRAGQVIQSLLSGL